VHVAQLLNPLLFTPYIEIVKPLLPDMLGRHAEQFLLSGHSPFAQGLQHASRESLLHRLHHPRRIAFLRLADQQMNVLRHHHVSHHHKTVALADSLQHLQEQIAALGSSQPWLAMITTTVDEMKAGWPTLWL